MGEIATSFRSEGAQAVLNDFDKLSKKEQELIVKGSKLGAQYDKMGRKAKGFGQKSKDSFIQMVTGITAANVASKAFTMTLNAVNSQIERQKRLQQESAASQRTYADALANYANNVRATFTPGELKTVEAFAGAQGKRIRGGPAEIMNSLADVSSKVGGIASPGEIRKAIEQQVTLKSGGQSSINIAESAAANLQLQKKGGLNQRQAENVISTFGGQAGGRADEFMSVLPGVLAAAKATGADPAEAASLLALFSKEASLDSARSATLTSNILGKTDPERLAKLGVKLKSTERIDQVVELMTRAQAGEFGADKFKVLSQAGLEGGLAAPILGILGKKEGRETLATFRQQMAFAKTTPRDLGAESVATLRGSQAVRTQAALGVTAGGKVTTAALDPELSAREELSQWNEALREKLGLAGGVIPGIQAVRIRTGGIEGDKAKEIIRSQIQAELQSSDITNLATVITDFIGGVTEAQLQARKDFLEGMEKLGDRIEKVEEKKQATVPPLRDQ